MSKRFLKGSSSSPAKRLKLDVTKEIVTPKERQPQNAFRNVQNDVNDLWGDDFMEDDFEQFDFVATQATQEESIFVQPEPRSTVTKSNDSSAKSSPFDPVPSTSSGFQAVPSRKNIPIRNRYDSGPQSQIIGSSAFDKKEIDVCTQAILFDDFENDVKGSSLNSTLRSSDKIVVTDDEQVAKWSEEKKKLLDDFLTKEGETEFLRQQLNQIQLRAESAKKEQARLMEEQRQKHNAEVNSLRKEKSSLESQLQLQNLQVNSLSEKCKLLESGSIKFTQPQVNMIKSHRDRNNTSLGQSINWNPKPVKTKENSVQVEISQPMEILKTKIVSYPLKIPQCAFEPSEPEKPIVEIKIEEKIGKRNLAIIQEEETFRIFENPELSKPKVTMIDGKILSTEFFMPDLAQLMKKTSVELESAAVIPLINKLVATARELLLNLTLVLQNISQELQNDDIRDMNELYLSEFYEMPVPHTRNMCEAQPWYDLERGIESRRACVILAHVALVSDYLANYIVGIRKLQVANDPQYQKYISQMVSYKAWNKKDFDFEFLDLVAEFVNVVGTIRRSHQFAGLINALMTLIINVQSKVQFPSLGLERICNIYKEIVYSRPLLSCFITMSNVLKEFSVYPSFVSKLCVSPERSGINYWKGSLNFTPGKNGNQDSCILEIFIAQLDHFKLDPITIINIAKDLASFSTTSLLSNSLPWLEKTMNSCNCCLNLLKFVIMNLCECAKIDVSKLKDEYAKSYNNWEYSRHQFDEKDKIMLRNKSIEKCKSFEKSLEENFLNELRKSQYCAVAYGIRLLSFLAKRDVDFIIRLTYIEDAFHLFLNYLNKRRDLKLKNCDEVALDIVKQTFVLEKMIENKEDQHTLNLVEIESESWIHSLPPNQDFTKFYENPLISE